MNHFKNAPYWVVAFVLLLHWNTIIITGERLLTKLLEWELYTIFQVAIILTVLLAVFVAILALNDLFIHYHTQRDYNDTTNFPGFSSLILNSVKHLQQDVTFWFQQEARQIGFLKGEKKITRLNNILIKAHGQLNRLQQLKQQATTLDYGLEWIQDRIDIIEALIEDIEQQVKDAEREKQNMSLIMDLTQLDREVEQTKEDLTKLPNTKEMGYPSVEENATDYNIKNGYYDARDFV